MSELIGISGSPGSGKTTVAKMLSDRIGIRFHSMGSVFRSIADEKKLSLKELSALAESDSSIDHLIDRRQSEMLRAGGIIMDSRLSCWLMKRNNINGLKVWITAPLDVRAKRVAGREGIGMAEARESIRAREESEADRYRKYYGIDMKDLSIYDIVINNAWMSPEDCCDVILAVMGK
jgi:predicted cytidylate kinase